MTRPAGPTNLYRKILELLEADRPCAVATVLEAARSTPVPAGAKAVIEANGTIHGTVGGGAVEAEAQRQARSVLQSGKPVVFEFSLGGHGVQQPDPICGGTMRLLVARMSGADARHCRRAVAALARRESGVWQTILRHRRRLVLQSRFLAEADFPAQRGPVSREVLSAVLREQRPALLELAGTPGGERLEVFVEPLAPAPVLVIVGGGHVGQALAAQADLLGFEIVVVEDRPEFANPARFPERTKIRCGSVSEQLGLQAVNPDTFIVIVTRGHDQDSMALRACIRRTAGYIGMIGSRRKIPLLRRQFLENAWATREEFDRVHAPIGLDIGAVTVPEIAASILAQIICVRRKGQASRMPRR